MLLQVIPQYKEAVSKIFAVLDVDGSDSLGIDEFVEGLLRVTEPSNDRHILVRPGRQQYNQRRN